MNDAGRPGGEAVEAVGMPRGAVWAPLAGSVELVVSGARIALVPAEEGFFELPSAAAALLTPGARYGFVVDGGGPVPDPRSRAQPDGVHGLSAVVDPAFPWTDDAFRPRPLAGGLVMEVHVGTFSPEGTFDGAAARLEHLVELGVTHLELLPVASFSGQWGWGYDGVALFSVHEPYGGAAGLRRFVDACHRRGLAVLLDVVYNHLGPTGNYLGRFGPYFTERHHTPWGSAVNFDDRGSEQVRRFFLDNARMWFEEYHLDGLRLDAIHAIVDGSALPFLEELAAETEVMAARLGKELVLVAESDLNDPRVVRSRDAGGLGLSAQWSDDFHHALHVALTRERDGYYADYQGLADVARALERGWVYEGQRSAQRGRRHGRPFGELSGHRLLGYLQTHDQVGNRARGERIAALVGAERAKVGLALVLTSPFVPLLFAGEEWGSLTPFQYFTNHQEPELAESVRQGRRREFASFGWDPDDVPDPQDPQTFLHSKLDWSALSSPVHADVLRFTRELVRLRRRRPELSDGDLRRVRCDVDEEHGWLMVRRGALGIVANLGGEQRIPLGAGARILLSSREGARIEGPALDAPADAAVIVELL